MRAQKLLDEAREKHVATTAEVARIEAVLAMFPDAESDRPHPQAPIVFMAQSAHEVAVSFDPECLRHQPPTCARAALYITLDTPGGAVRVYSPAHFNVTEGFGIWYARVEYLTQQGGRAAPLGSLADALRSTCDDADLAARAVRR